MRSKLFKRTSSFIRLIGCVGFVLLLGAKCFAQPEAWQIIANFQDTGWNAIHFFDSQNGLIGGIFNQEYCLMRTSNGGYDWEGVIEWSSSFSVIDIQFYDRMRGFLVGNHRAGLTYDGGETWEILHFGGQAIASAIYMDSLRMLAVSNEIAFPEGTIRRYYLSFDGGRSWEQRYQEFGYDGFGLPAISESGTLVMSAGYNTLWRSTNYGESWEVVNDLPLRTNSRFASPSAGVFIDAGVLLGRYPAIARSADDGLTWEIVWRDSTLQRYYFSDIEFPDSRHGWAASENLIVQTHDGGETWSGYLVEGAWPGLDDLTFVDSTLGWATDGSFDATNIFRYGTPSVIHPDTNLSLPTRLNFVSAFPNPFNSTINITLEAPLHSETTLTLYDLLGREVEVIHRGRLSGTTLSYTAPPALSSGIYFLRAASASHSAMQKVVLLK